MGATSAVKNREPEEIEETPYQKPQAKILAPTSRAIGDQQSAISKIQEYSLPLQKEQIDGTCLNHTINL